MLVSKTPLRVSFLGGGTDFPWFFEKYGGAVISAAISKHIYISAIPSYDGMTTYLKYSRYEKVEDLFQIKHPIFRTVLSLRDIRAMDFAVVADIPAGNGLASSSAFTVGLLKLSHGIQNIEASSLDLAREAINVELDLLGEPIGIQDQCASAFGGLRSYTFGQDRAISSLAFMSDVREFPYALLLVKVGSARRSASKFTKEQELFVVGNPKALDSLKELRDLTHEAISEISTNIEKLPHFVNLGWTLKMKSNPNAGTAGVEKVLALGFQSGASAGKLVGAGGSGFILFLCERSRLSTMTREFTSRGYKIIEVELENTGSELVKV